MVKQIYTLGRGSGNDVVLNESNVSTQHARLIVDGDEIVIEDLGSTNGTAVGRVENKVSRCVLQPTDTIYFGSTPFAVSELLAIATLGDKAPQSVTDSTSHSPGQWQSPFRLVVFAGLAIVMLMVIVGIVIAFTKGNGDDQGPQIVDQGKVERTENLARTNEDRAEVAPTSVDPLTADEILKRSLFLVICADSERSTSFRVGNAFAIDAQHVVTTGVVIQAIRELQETGFPEVYLYSPSLNQEWPIAEMDVHPQYAMAGSDARQAQQIHDQLVDQIESNPPADPTQMEQVKEKLIDARVTALEAMDRKTCFDAALVRVSQPLENWLESPETQGTFRPKQRLQVIGYAFDVEDRFFDRQVGHEMTSFDGRVAQLWQQTDVAASRLIVSATDEQQELAFHGCPVLNTQGQVVGLYSRPSPPPEPGVESVTEKSFDCVLFQHVHELIDREN